MYQGDMGACRQIVYRYDKRLVYWARRLGKDPDKAREVAQEVWSHFLQAIKEGNLRQLVPLHIYLFRKTHDKCVEFTRKDSRKRAREIDLGKQFLDPEDNRHPNPAEYCMNKEQIKSFHKSLKKLSPRHRKVITLRYLEDMSYLEIAQVLRCPVGTVRSRINNAKRYLQQMMEVRQ